MASTENTQIINAPVAAVFAAFADPKSLEQWLVPFGMTGKVHAFDFRAGGGYEMSLYYPDSEGGPTGKTGIREDRYKAIYKEIVPNEKLVQVSVFDTDDASFAGEMIETVLFERLPHDRTMLVMKFGNIPPGISPEDNEAGTASSLQKLAAWVEGHSR